VKHVEIGLTDNSDAAGWAARWLAARGITGGLVLVLGGEFGPIGSLPGRDSFLAVPELGRAVVVSVGVEPGGIPDGVLHVGGGADRLTVLLDAQLARRAERRVPNIDVDPAWVLRLPEDPAKERSAEALGALSNGWAGTRGAREEDGPATSPLFVVNDVYTDSDAPRLLHGPQWTGLALRRTHGQPREESRLLDLRTGVLVRAVDDTTHLRSLRFVSAANSFAFGMRAEGRKPYLDAGEPLTAPRDPVGLERECRGEVHLARTGDASGGGIVVAARDSVGDSGPVRVVERLAAWSAISAGVASWEEAAARLTEIEAAGFERLLAEHRGAWARRWADAEVTIDGSPDDQLAARLAVFHLLSAAGDEGETAVGARGLTGDAYGGHVFWDADVFVLPVLAAIRPGAARAMLEYRIRRLPAARAAAARLGLSGARFAWESATDGTDVTPRHVRGGHGELIAIRTGQHEEHIVADVAWAAVNYAAWTGDEAFLTGVGRDLLVDTARYWASRIRRDHDGAGHVYGAMGPDEYHDVVDDNAYTNVMARWNLRRGADLLIETVADRDEARGWQDLADALVDGWDAQRGLYEQFAGYWDLEPLLMAQIGPPPVAVDMLLGAERVAGSQLIKQADVLMLHHLVPDEVVPGSLANCLQFYEPRCAHGSSLSPAVHASLLASAGRPDRALELFRLASRLDLDDLTGTTAGGIHLATMGGVWQALAVGFLGLRPSGDTLNIFPCLPDEWDALGLRFRFHGQPVGVRADHDTITIACAAPLLVRVGLQATRFCLPPGCTFPFERSQP
jgi:trehalose/maltose hydrolase-like predicted phosphorylase